MKLLTPLFFVLLLVPTTNITAQGTDPLSVVKGFRAAYNDGNVEAAVNFYANDAEITNTRGRKFIGKKAIRKFTQNNLAAGERVASGDPKVTGDAATLIARVTTDFYVKLGVAPIGISGRWIVRDGKIKSETHYFPPISLVKIRQACASPQAQGVLLFGQPCNEFLEQAVAQTKSVVATLKPYSAETDYKSLQGYLSPIAP